MLKSYWRKSGQTYHRHWQLWIARLQYYDTQLYASIARLTGKRVLFWTHGWRRTEAGPKAWIRNSFYHRAHGLLLYRERAKKIGHQQGFNPEQLHVIFNSLDYEKQKQSRERATLDKILATRQRLFEFSQRPMLIYLGRLIPRKRIDVLLEAIFELAQLGHPVNTLIVGDGPEREQLSRTCVKKKPLRKIHGGML